VRIGKPVPGARRQARRCGGRDAGLDHIDYLLVTHFHPDHYGGVVELSQLMPIRHFIDHGTLAAELQKDAGAEGAFEAYLAIRNKRPHLEPKPAIGYRSKELRRPWSVRQGRASPGLFLAPVEVNGACGPAAVAARDPYENPRSTGVVVRYGKFSFLDVGDLSGAPLFALVCPKSLIGPVDVYLVAHHGGPDVADPAIFAAFVPRLAVMNNGLTKGGAVDDV